MRLQLERRFFEEGAFVVTADTIREFGWFTPPRNEAT
jgi:hypothetical protein